MRELHIDSAGEVRLGTDIVGHISWAGPCAHYDVAGEWESDAGSYCFGCGGFLASAEDFEDAEAERDRLEDENDKPQAEIKRLRTALEGMMDAYDRATGNQVLPEYQAAHKALSALKDKSDG